jgi:hypothetical protein
MLGHQYMLILMQIHNPFFLKGIHNDSLKNGPTLSQSRHLWDICIWKCRKLINISQILSKISDVLDTICSHMVNGGFNSSQ